MRLSFEPLDRSHQRAYQAYLAKCPEVASDYGFINLFAWADAYGLEIAWTGDLAFIRQQRPEAVLWSPVGDWHGVDWAAWQADYADDFKTFIRVPGTLADIWQQSFGDRMVLAGDRDLWDYLYDARELRELKGNKFHKKKNLVNQFKKKNTYTYVEMTGELADQAMALQHDWCSWRACDSLRQLEDENRAIMKTLGSWDSLAGIMGACIFVDDLIVAYTIGEMLSPDTLAVHFEKGCPDYKGSYQAINQLFLAHQPDTVRWVNREADLGDEGLKQAKLSYQPVDFLKKYRIRF
ncbi:MAG: DUF2156 domain-containing protein [Desulfobacterales bacterium]